MNHLIVYSNPEKESFSHDIKEYVSDYSLKRGHSVEVRDLYEMEFNPILTSKELEYLERGKVFEDVKKEQDYLDWADCITFIYPIWWQIPAMMKGYFDRVFSYEYAYAFRDGKPTGLLREKPVLRYNPMGTPREIYEKNGLRSAYQKAIDSGIINSSGLKVVDSILFGGSPRHDDDLKKKYLKEVEESLEKVLILKEEH